MLKRCFDLCVVLGLLPLWLPVTLGIALLVRLKLGSPILFRQLRAGLHGRPFTLIKFRTMRDAYDSRGRLLPDDERLTAFGRGLRASSLDELPELWHVLRGEMSLVGPRPLLVGYLGRYTPRQARRHDVRPGVTGWAQVNGRNAVAWEERLALDVWYVDHESLRLDLKILALTVWKILRREGINSGGGGAMPEFVGRGGGEDSGETFAV